jgi:hypothetical protein
MLELAVLVGGVALAALGLVLALNARADWAERDRLRRFQEAMRRADSPKPHNRED